MYRAPAQLPPQDEADPELVYDVPFERKAGSFSRARVTLLFAAYAVVIAAITAADATPLVCAVAVIVLGVGTAWWWRQQPDSAMILRVHDGNLSIRLRRPKRADAPPLAQMRLADLVDVTLEGEEYPHIEDGSSATTARHATEYRAAHDDTSRLRVLLLPREGEPIVVGRAPIPHADATEWLGTIRVFLRKHQWLPDDERPALSSSLDKSTKEQKYDAAAPSQSVGVESSS